MNQRFLRTRWGLIKGPVVLGMTSSAVMCLATRLPVVLPGQAPADRPLALDLVAPVVGVHLDREVLLGDQVVRSRAVRRVVTHRRAAVVMSRLIRLASSR